jgi:hypothetical protein
LTEEQSKSDLAGLIADIAREECRKLYEKRLAGLERRAVSPRGDVTQWAIH